MPISSRKGERKEGREMVRKRNFGNVTWKASLGRERSLFKERSTIRRLVRPANWPNCRLSTWLELRSMIWMLARPSFCTLEILLWCSLRICRLERFSNTNTNTNTNKNKIINTNTYQHKYKSNLRICKLERFSREEPSKSVS